MPTGYGWVCLGMRLNMPGYADWVGRLCVPGYADWVYMGLPVYARVCLGMPGSARFAGTQCVDITNTDRIIFY